MSLPDINSTDFLVTNFFGFGASNPTYITLPVPYDSQIGITVNAASYTDGFPPSTMTPENSGGLPFFGQDMNGILAMVSANVATLAAGSIPAFSSTRASAIGGYPAGSIVASTVGDGFWLCITDGATNDPDSSAGNWRPLSCIGGGTAINVSNANIVLDSQQAQQYIVTMVGTLTANVVITFPSWVGQQWLVANFTSGSFTITCQTSAAATAIVIPQGGYSQAQSCFADGANLYTNNVSTAGLAPIASPALTGTPTAPTASATSNTTQIATTAMVQAAITAALTIYARLASPIFSGTPTVPTASPGTNTLQAASTAFVQAAVGTIPTIRTGTFTCANTGTSLTFSPAFPTACTGLQLTHANVANGSNIGFAGYNSLSRTGAVCYASINGTQINYVAIGS